MGPRPQAARVAADPLCRSGCRRSSSTTMGYVLRNLQPETMAFGRPMRQHWSLDPAVTYLNHGTVGVIPKRVLAAQQAIRDQIERQPAAFLLRELWNFTGSSRSTPTLLREAAARVAAFVGGRGEDLVFVDNATTWHQRRVAFASSDPRRRDDTDRPCLRCDREHRGVRCPSPRSFRTHDPGALSLLRSRYAGGSYR